MSHLNNSLLEFQTLHLSISPKMIDEMDGYCESSFRFEAILHNDLLKKFNIR